MDASPSLEAEEIRRNQPKEGWGAEKKGPVK